MGGVITNEHSRPLHAAPIKRKTYHKKNAGKEGVLAGAMIMHANVNQAKGLAVP